MFLPSSFVWWWWCRLALVSPLLTNGMHCTVQTLAEEVQAFARSFPMPGWKVDEMRYGPKSE